MGEVFEVTCNLFLKVAHRIYPHLVDVLSHPTQAYFVQWEIALIDGERAIKFTSPTKIDVLGARTAPLRAFMREAQIDRRGIHKAAREG